MKSEENKLAYKQKRTQQINNKYKNKRKQKKRKNKRHSRCFIQFLRRFEHWYLVQPHHLPLLRTLHVQWQHLLFP